jgi:hypothetical protein
VQDSAGFWKKSNVISWIMNVGGLARNRTGVQGFAVLCVATPPRGLWAAESIQFSGKPAAHTKEQGLRQAIACVSVTNWITVIYSRIWGLHSASGLLYDARPPGTVPR